MGYSRGEGVAIALVFMLLPIPFVITRFWLRLRLNSKIRPWIDDYLILVSLVNSFLHESHYFTD